MPCPLTPLFPVNPVLHLSWVSKTSRKPWITSRTLAARESGKCGFQISSLCSTRRELRKRLGPMLSQLDFLYQPHKSDLMMPPFQLALCDFGWAVFLPETLCVHHQALPLHVQLSEIGRDHPLSGPHHQPVQSSSNALICSPSSYYNCNYTVIFLNVDLLSFC